MNERVIKIIEIYNLSPSRFADKIGVPRSTISHIISGRNQPSLELISKISDKFPDVNLDWLIKGKGDMMNTLNTVSSKSFDKGNTTTEDIPSHKGPNVQSDKPSNKPSKNYELDFTGKESIEADIPDKDKTPKNNKISEANSLQDKQPGKIKKSPGDITKIVLVYDDNSFEVIYPR